ncbi:MAG: tryptophan-rich sensory protein [Alphaproteobacteria bacterium]|nr:tryptophan-rich sensory protein [Alphaproteobacteria bacterium]
MTERNKNISALIIFVGLCVLTGLFSSFIMTDGLKLWYPDLVKAPFNPPDWLFAPVWSVIYIMMGLALWFAWKERKEESFRVAGVLFTVQLFLNGLWSFLFFYLQNPLAGFVDILCLDLVLIITIAVFYRFSSKAAWLLSPYITWLLFATYLNGYIVYAN